MWHRRAQTPEEFYNPVYRTDIQPVVAYENANIWIADETHQRTGSFKVRGSHFMSCVRLEQDPGLRRRGITTASAGNAGQGTALTAQYHNTDAIIFLPEGAADVKVEAIETLGAETVLVAGTVDDALFVAEKFAAESGYLFIPPFDHELVIAGQASLGYEIAEHDEIFSTVFVPVGGGGLLAGVSSALSQVKPNTKVFGVQLDQCDAFSQGFEQKRVVELERLSDVAKAVDGTAVRKAGTFTLERVLDHRNSSFGGMIRVTPNELVQAIDLLDENTDIIAETAAALSYAGLLHYLDRNGNPAGNHLAVITGRHRDNNRVDQLRAA